MPDICRFCDYPLEHTFVDLGMSPISNDFIAADRRQAMEPFYPLHAYVCLNCFLVQLIDFQRADHMFSDEYHYFSSFSDQWLDHSRRFAEEAIAREALGPQSFVVEVASNDGYLLQFFKRAGVRVLGIEPTANTAQAAYENHGIVSETVFFGRETAIAIAERWGKADLMAANNVLAHVPDIGDFVAGFAQLLKQGGVAHFEFPHLLNMIAQTQFDTIYHEHFSYLSLAVCRRIFAVHGLRVYDVTELPTHGGSLRLFVAHDADARRPDTPAIGAMLERERQAGLTSRDTYDGFAAQCVRVKNDLVDFLIAAHRRGKRVVGYGAPAKGNTLLNYCGIKPDLLPFTVDRSPHKVGKWLPGCRIPVRSVDDLLLERPDYVLIFPWNLKDEVMAQLDAIREWGGQFVIPIPRLAIL